MKILFFAELEEKAGTREVEIKAEPMTIKALKEILRAQYSDLPSLNNTIVAVNEEYADEDTVINENDIVAFIPPVSGG